ncbi:hypothetical protein LDENG_00104190, partial [Lucifuga dentata]
TDEWKVELCGTQGSHYIWHQPITAFHSNNTILRSAWRCGSVMVWGCFAASGPGRLAIIEGNMNSALYQKILKENVRSSVCDVKLKLGSAAR